MSADEIAADLTNSLVPGVVLVPSVVAFIAELQRAGYSYAKAGWARRNARVGDYHCATFDPLPRRARTFRS